MTKIKWGIVGTGNIASQFASDFQFSEYAELHAVASRKQDTANLFGSQFKIPKAYASYEALFADDSIDAVYIATPHNFHFENSRAAIIAGKAVLCEKPLTIDSGSATELINFATAHEVYLMEAMWTYFLPTIIKAQEWVKDGRIGDLVQIKADLGFKAFFDPKKRLYNPLLSGGSTWDLGIYPLAATCLFLDRNPDRIKVMGHRAITGVDDEVNIMLDFGNQSANLAASFRTNMANELLIMGSEASIRVKDFWRSKECTLFSRTGLIDQFVDDRSSIGYNFELDVMSKDLLNGKKEPSTMTHRRSIQLQRLMEKVLNEF